MFSCNSILLPEQPNFTLNQERPGDAIDVKRDWRHSVQVSSDVQVLWDKNKNKRKRCMDAFSPIFRDFAAYIKSEMKSVGHNREKMMQYVSREAR